MNKVILIGRLTREPDIKYSVGEQASMTVARYSLAVDKKVKKDAEKSADFISCIAFGSNGDFAEKYLKKGMKIAVVGQIRTGSYTNKDGVKVYTTDVVVESHEFCESRQQSSNAGAAVDADGFMAIPDGMGDEGLPF